MLSFHHVVQGPSGGRFNVPHSIAFDSVVYKGGSFVLSRDSCIYYRSV